MTDTANPIRLPRSQGIGGTDAMRIMQGDWLPLYLEKIGEAEPEDLSNVFKVQLGIYTESFHAEWFTKQTGLTILGVKSTQVHPDHDWMLANLDGWLVSEDCFVEFKHTRGGALAWDKARYYMPQLQHYMAVTRSERCYFSIIPGNDEPRHVVVERDDAYIAKLIDLERSFWWHVTERVQPDIIPVGEIARTDKLAEAIKVDGLRIADMTSDNLWADAASRFISYQQAAREFEVAKDDLKSVIGSDVGQAYGHGVIAKRDKRGRITIKAEKGAANDNE